MDLKSVPMLVPPSQPTPYEVIPLTRGSVMAGLNTLVTTHVLVFRPDKELELGGARPADLLRSGLAQVLVPYYPLAGRIVENETGWEVQCDGQGAVYIVTTAPDFEEIVVYQGHMQQGNSSEIPIVVLPPPDHHHHQPYLLPPSPPPPPPTTHVVQTHTPTLVVQVTEVDIGGFILSIKMYKGICDSAGLIHFLCGWAEMARGKPHVSVLPVWGEQKLHDAPFFSTLATSDNNAKFQNPIPITNGECTRYQIHLPNLEKQGSEFFDEEQGTFTCNHHSKLYKAPITERIKVGIPFEVIKALTDWIFVEERCSCTAAQVLTAHIWRERTRALHVPKDAEARLFFISKVEQDLPIAFYGSFAFNCQVKARVNDLVDMPLVYAVQLIQEADANLVSNFRTCTSEFEEVHCSCGFVPLEVLLLTILPTTNTDKYLDFGVLGKPLASSLDTLHFPSNVNIAALVPSPHSYESTFNIFMNNVPFVHVSDLRSLLCSMPTYASKSSKI